MPDDNAGPGACVPPRQFFGKYRGKVLDNIDPDLIGRLLVDVPAVPSAKLCWALPCSPYAGPELGFFALPPIGANVWVEFEGGDPNHPIWSGCFWVRGETPLPAGIPGITVFRTPTFNLVIIDEEGATLTVIPPAVEEPIVVAINAEGITMTVPTSVVHIGLTEIELTAPPGAIIIDQEEGINIVHPELISASAAEITTKGNLSQTGASEFLGNVDITGAVEIEGNVDITGAMEVEGNVEIAGNMEVEAVDISLAGAAIELNAAAVEIAGAGIALTGAVEITGDALLDGLQILAI